MKIFHQNRILKWNVSIMVILILLACSLMGILTVVFLKSLITYTDDTYSYHKSYYIAKAWLELALTEIDNSVMWFSQDLDSGSVINNNFECVWCHFISRIQWRSKIISNDFWENDECTDENALVLQPWQSLTIPMFYDNTTDFNQILSGVPTIKKFLENDLKVLWITCFGNCPLEHLNVWVIFQEFNLEWDISWEYLYMTGILMSETNFFMKYVTAFNHFDGYPAVWSSNNYYPYIVLSNPNDTAVKFCIKSNDDQWPTTKYFISSLWEYMWKAVWLQAIYAQPTPSFFINAYSSEGWNWQAVYSQVESY